MPALNPLHKRLQRYTPFSRMRNYDSFHLQKDAWYTPKSKAAKSLKEFAA